MRCVMHNGICAVPFNAYLWNDEAVEKCNFFIWLIKGKGVVGIFQSIDSVFARCKVKEPEIAIFVCFCQVVWFAGFECAVGGIFVKHNQCILYFIFSPGICYAAPHSE